MPCKKQVIMSHCHMKPRDCTNRQLASKHGQDASADDAGDERSRWNRVPRNHRQHRRSGNEEK